MYAGNPGASLRPTYGGSGKAVRVTEAFLGQLIKSWRLCIRVSVAADPLHIIIFRCDPNDIRYIRQDGGSVQQESDQTEAKKAKSGAIDHSDAS